MSISTYVTLLIYLSNYSFSFKLTPPACFYYLHCLFYFWFFTLLNSGECGLPINGSHQYMWNMTMAHGIPYITLLPRSLPIWNYRGGDITTMYIIHLCVYWKLLLYERRTEMGEKLWSMGTPSSHYTYMAHFDHGTYSLWGQLQHWCWSYGWM